MMRREGLEAFTSVMILRGGGVVPNGKAPQNTYTEEQFPCSKDPDRSVQQVFLTENAYERAVLLGHPQANCSSRTRFACSLAEQYSSRNQRQAGGVENSYFAHNDVDAGSIPAVDESPCSSVAEHDAVFDLFPGLQLVWPQLCLLRRRQGDVWARFT